MAAIWNFPIHGCALWRCAVSGRCVVPAGDRRWGCLLVLECVQDVESGCSAGGEGGGRGSGCDREQDEVGELLFGEVESDPEAPERAGGERGEEYAQG